MMDTLYLRFPNETAAVAALDGMAERGETAADRAALAACVINPANPFGVFA